MRFPSLFLLHPDEVVSVVTSLLGFAEDLVAGVLTHIGGAGQYPEILVALATDEGVGVVGGEHHDAIVGVERAPETDTQQTGSGGEFAFAFRRFPLAIFETLVDDLHLAVLLNGVDGGDLLHIALEFVIEAGNLVPSPHETIEIEGFDGGVIDR